MTVPTCRRSAAWTTVPTALLAGNRLMSSVRIMIRSACLPGVREPIRSSSPAQRAPSLVAALRIVLNRHRSRRVFIAGIAAVLREGALQREGGAHLREHVPTIGGFEVGADARP
jgi:hypothetical protein